MRGRLNDLGERRRKRGRSVAARENSGGRLAVPTLPGEDRGGERGRFPLLGCDVVPSEAKETWRISAKDTSLKGSSGREGSPAVPHLARHIPDLPSSSALSPSSIVLLLRPRLLQVPDVLIPGVHRLPHLMMFRSRASRRRRSSGIPVREVLVMRSNGLRRLDDGRRSRSFLLRRKRRRRRGGWDGFRFWIPSHEVDPAVSRQGHVSSLGCSVRSRPPPPPLLGDLLQLLQSESASRRAAFPGCNGSRNLKRSEGVRRSDEFVVHAEPSVDEGVVVVGERSGGRRAGGSVGEGGPRLLSADEVNGVDLGSVVFVGRSVGVGCRWGRVIADGRKKWRKPT
jgi:hypothetical protein